jgi:putative addiction module component (TIGR02574 family)
MLLTMTERARKLLQDAMELPLPERAELAAHLLSSFDSEPASEVEAAWTVELERRAREAIAAPDDDFSWVAVRAELHVR